MGTKTSSSASLSNEGNYPEEAVAFPALDSKPPSLAANIETASVATAAANRLRPDFTACEASCVKRQALEAPHLIMNLNPKPYLTPHSRSPIYLKTLRLPVRPFLGNSDM